MLLIVLKFDDDAWIDRFNKVNLGNGKIKDNFNSYVICSNCT